MGKKAILCSIDAFAKQHYKTIGELLKNSYDHKASDDSDDKTILYSRRLNPAVAQLAYQRVVTKMGEIKPDSNGDYDFEQDFINAVVAECAVLIDEKAATDAGQIGSSKYIMPKSNLQYTGNHAQQTFETVDKHSNQIFICIDSIPSTEGRRNLVTLPMKNGKSSWTDADIEEFTKQMDQALTHLEELWRSEDEAYEGIVLPTKDGKLFGLKNHGDISATRCPKIYEAMQSLLFKHGLQELIDMNDGFRGIKDKQEALARRHKKAKDRAIANFQREAPLTPVPAFDENAITDPLTTAYPETAVKMARIHNISMALSSFIDNRFNDSLNWVKAKLNDPECEDKEKYQRYLDMMSSQDPSESRTNWLGIYSSIEKARYKDLCTQSYIEQFNEAVEGMDPSSDEYIEMRQELEIAIADESNNIDAMKINLIEDFMSDFSTGIRDINQLLQAGDANALYNYFYERDNDAANDNAFKALLRQAFEVKRANLTKSRFKSDKKSAEQFSRVVANTCQSVVNAFKDLMADENDNMSDIGNQLMAALLDKASDDISFRENIVLEFKTDERPREKDYTESNSEDSEGEPVNQAAAGLTLVNYHMQEPAKSLSVRMKKDFGSCVKLDGKGNPVFDSIGLPIMMNPSVAYNQLQNEFVEMYEPSQLDAFMQKALKKYPWAKPLLEKMQNDSDWKAEFYRTMQNNFVIAKKVNPDGSIATFNNQTGVKFAVEKAESNYENGIILGERRAVGPNGKPVVLSVYNEDVTLNVEGKAALANALGDSAQLGKSIDNLYKSKQKNEERWGKRSEGYPELITLLHNIAADDKRSIRLQDVIKGIGIDADQLDWDSLVPQITSEEIKEIYEATIGQVDQSNTTAYNAAVKEFDKQLEDKYQLTTKLQRLQKIKGLLQTIIHNYTATQPLVSASEKAWISLVDQLEYSNENFQQQSYLVFGKSRQSMEKPDMIGTFALRMKGMNDAEAKQFFREHFYNYTFYQNGACAWADQLADSADLRKAMTYQKYLALNGEENEFDSSIGKASNTAFMSAIYAIYKNSRSADGTTEFVNPMYSDVDAMETIRMPDVTVEEAITQMSRLAAAEVRRIRDARKAKGEKGHVEIEFYDKNSLMFCFFPTLNNDPAAMAIVDDSELQGEDIVKALESRITEMMAKSIADFMSTREGSAIFKKIKQDITSENNSKKDNEKLTEEQITEQAYNEFSRFVHNFTNGQLQWSALFSGDLAYYKNYDDYVKRAKEMYACGEKGFFRPEDTERCIYMFDQEEIGLNFEGVKDILGNDNGSSFADRMERSMLLGMVNQYMLITKTDGQSLRTLSSFKKIYQGLGGKWNDEMERNFQILQQSQKKPGEKSQVSQETVRALTFMLQTLKPFMITHEALQINGRTEKVFSQHKNSEYALSAAFGALSSVFSQSPRLIALQQFMAENNIDVIHFNSCVKHGFRRDTAFNLNYDSAQFAKLQADKNNTRAIKASNVEDYVKTLTADLIAGNISQAEFNELYDEVAFSGSKDIEGQTKRAYEQLKAQAKLFTDAHPAEAESYVHTFPLSDMMIVQPTDDHLIGEEGENVLAKAGSQLRNLLPADLPEDFVHTFELTRRKHDAPKITMDKQETLNLYNQLWNRMMLDNFGKLDERFKDPKKLEAFLQEQMAGNPQYDSNDMRQALKLVKLSDGTIDFRVPINAPNIKNKIEQLILSSFKNAIQISKIKGGSVVLVSDYGLSDDLHINWVDPNDHSKGYKSMEVYMPAPDREMYKDFLKRDKDAEGNEIGPEYIDMEALRRADEHGDLLEGVAYRIPTEDKYSAMKIIIKGFLPESMGSNIIMPAEVVTMSGTDFKQH